MIHGKATVKSWAALFGSQGCLFLSPVKAGEQLHGYSFCLPLGHRNWEDGRQKSRVWALLGHSSCPLVPGSDSSHSVPCLLSLWSLPLSCLQGGRWRAGLAENKDSYPWLPPVSLCMPALSCRAPSACLIDTAKPLGRGFFDFFFLLKKFSAFFCG